MVKKKNRNAGAGLVTFAISPASNLLACANFLSAPFFFLPSLKRKRERKENIRIVTIHMRL
jgi:hypothetical protein